MPLINKQPNSIVKFCPIDIPLVQSWWQYGVKFGDPQFDIISRFTYPKTAVLFFSLLTFAEIRPSNWLKGFFLFESVKKKNRLKRTVKKEPLFWYILTGHTCAKYMRFNLPSLSWFFFRLHCKLLGVT